MQICCKMFVFLSHYSHIVVAARMGQSFSRATPTIQLSPNQLQKVPDIERNGYCFTDGCGEISLDLAEKISEELKLDDIPSVFQIRLGSLKGVLVVNTSIQGKVIYRESQEKFLIENMTPAHLTVEVVKTSNVSSKGGFLNRQFIMILHERGVPDSFFIDKQREYMEKFSLIMDTPEQAASFLTAYTTSDDSTIGKKLLCHILADHNISDPYIRNSLQNLQVNCFKSLKQRAHIPVPSCRFVIHIIF